MHNSVWTMLKWISNKSAKFDQNIPCGLRFMSIYTNWPLPTWLMLGKTLSAKRNCYAWTMLTCIRMQNLTRPYHLVINLGAINNDRTTAKEWTAAEATGCLNALWRQIFALDYAGFLLNTNVLSSKRVFLTYAKHYHRKTNYQWFGETKKMAYRELELKSTSSWAMVGPAENKHNGPA